MKHFIIAGSLGTDGGAACYNLQIMQADGNESRPIRISDSAHGHTSPELSLGGYCLCRERIREFFERFKRGTVLQHLWFCNIYRGHTFDSPFSVLHKIYFDDRTI